MNLVGLSTATFVSGLAALIVALGALHLLRVRMRRQVVDSLLFFRTAALQARPRVLGKKLARLGTFLLGAALLALAWTAFGEPMRSDAATSRVLVIDRTDAARAASADGRELAAVFAADAQAVADASALGPRGAVIVVGEATRGVLRADEPVAMLGERIAALPVGGAPSSIEEVLTAAAHTLRPGDELVLFGGPEHVAAQLDGIPVRRAAAPAATGVALPTPAAAPRRRIFAEDGLPQAIAFALAARDDVELVALRDADVAIAAASSALPATMPALRIETRSDGLLREARVTVDCDAPLSLRDRSRGERAGFRPSADEVLWVADPRHELALVAAGAKHVRVASSWFDDLAHRDVPLLIDAALRHVMASAVDRDSARNAPASSPARSGEPLATLGGSGALAPLLLGLALLLLSIDAFLLGRGRVA